MGRFGNPLWVEGNGDQDLLPVELDISELPQQPGRGGRMAQGCVTSHTKLCEIPSAESSFEVGGTHLGSAETRALLGRANEGNRPPPSPSLCSSGCSSYSTTQPSHLTTSRPPNCPPSPTCSLPVMAFSCLESHCCQRPSSRPACPPWRLPRSSWMPTCTSVLAPWPSPLGPCHSASPGCPQAVILLGCHRGTVRWRT